MIEGAIGKVAAGNMTDIALRIWRSQLSQLNVVHWTWSFCGGAVMAMGADKIGHVSTGVIDIKIVFKQAFGRMTGMAVYSRNVAMYSRCTWTSGADANMVAIVTGITIQYVSIQHRAMVEAGHFKIERGRGMAIITFELRSVA